MATIDPTKKDFIHGLFTVKFKNIVFFYQGRERQERGRDSPFYMFTVYIVAWHVRIRENETYKQMEGFLDLKFLFYHFGIEIVLEL